MVYVEKKSKERHVCAGFSMGLNNAPKNYYYRFPGPEEVLVQLSEGWIFLKIDLSNTYFQIEEDNKCSKLSMINIHRGVYKFNHLAFRIKISPAIFQQVMDMMLSGLEFAVTYLEDIMLKSENAEHKNVLRF